MLLNKLEPIYICMVRESVFPPGFIRFYRHWRILAVVVRDADVRTRRQDTVWGAGAIVRGTPCLRQKTSEGKIRQGHVPRDGAHPGAFIWYDRHIFVRFRILFLGSFNSWSFLWCLHSAWILRNFLQENCKKKNLVEKNKVRKSYYKTIM